MATRQLWIANHALTLLHINDDLNRAGQVEAASPLIIKLHIAPPGGRLHAGLGLVAANEQIPRARVAGSRPASTGSHRGAVLGHFVGEARGFGNGRGQLARFRERHPQLGLDLLEPDLVFLLLAPGVPQSSRSAADRWKSSPYRSGVVEIPARQGVCREATLKCLLGSRGD